MVPRGAALTALAEGVNVGTQHVDNGLALEAPDRVMVPGFIYDRERHTARAGGPGGPGGRAASREYR